MSIFPVTETSDEVDRSTVIQVGSCIRNNDLECCWSRKSLLRRSQPLERFPKRGATSVSSSTSEISMMILLAVHYIAGTAT